MWAKEAQGAKCIAWWPHCHQQQEWEQGLGLLVQGLVRTAGGSHWWTISGGLVWQTQPRNKIKTKWCHFLATSKAKLSWPIPDTITAGKAEQANQNLVFPLVPVLFLSNPDSLLNASLENGLKHWLSLKIFSPGGFAPRGWLAAEC